MSQITPHTRTTTVHGINAYQDMDGRIIANLPEQAGFTLHRLPELPKSKHHCKVGKRYPKTLQS